ncbi:Hypothetical protein YE3828 [Yersinia enterocolitica subsp. enterocolitica 8081]|uniref:Uncharacterized protein n=1 Tax=Yersinia enterocolitica serotype O:8 / biotype 1B (strain NCTC 13174 / 8081) TaxID=393305 RepID=A1JRN6_YERE8|nr:Hypothetical protein YE3828 [Yersinia enterocolitica subsp. enterocolitica 8081]
MYLSAVDIPPRQLPEHIKQLLCLLSSYFICRGYDIIRQKQASLIDSLSFVTIHYATPLLM